MVYNIYMKNYKFLSVLTLLGILMACSPIEDPTTGSTSSLNPTTEATTSEISVSNPTSSEEITTISPTQTTTEPTSIEPTSNPTTIPTTTPTSTPTTTPTTVPTTTPTTSKPTSTPTIEEETDEIPASGQTLPIGNGNKTVTGPENVKNPIDVTNWVNFDFYDSIPEYWSYIQGNNKVNSRGDFYAESAGGGFKFSQLYYGLQSPLLNTWKKLEVRLSISKVANNSQKKDVDEPIFHIYGYDITGQMIHTQYIEQGTITAQSEGKEVKFYLLNEDVCYFELRLNAFPYKGNQCYNFGVDEISIKGWQYE